MKRHMKLGLGVIALVVISGLLAVMLASATSGTAAAYNGPGQRLAQTTTTTTTPTAAAQPAPRPGYGGCNCLGDEDFNGTGMGMMNGYGRGGGGMGRGGGVATATGPLSDATKAFLTEAIQDEYQNRALYQAVIDKFGQVLPFTNIGRSESTHVAVLTRLFANHGLTAPADGYAGQVQAPATLQEAFQLAIQHEKDNVAMYDRFLTTVKEPDVVRLFTQLRAVSNNMHLQAFEYYNK